MLQSLRLSRDMMNLMLRGKSVIDSQQGITFGRLEDVSTFLQRYGYDLDDTVAMAEVQGNYQEALRFIRRYFLAPENPEGAHLEVPKVFLELNDIRNLFLWAQEKTIEPERVIRGGWACAVLRVMHAISHLDKDLRHDFFPEIQKQIFDRFYREIHTLEDQVYLGDPKVMAAVSLDKFLTKPRKSRDSLILKLLHKRETLAEDVFDQIGLRFVTKTRVDVVRVLKFLRDQHIVMSMNVRPSRSRNNLVDPLLYRRTWREVEQGVLRHEINSIEELRSRMEAALKVGFKAAQPDIVNPFSSQNYLSIQFTCRQLIKLGSPLYEEVKAARTFLKTLQSPDAQRVLDGLELGQLKREHRFFYPFEVQIMDSESYREAEEGRSSHAVYKAAQTKEAMNRVLGRLVGDTKDRDPEE
jgi:uncharacterized protein (TIGR04562 family)